MPHQLHLMGGQVIENSLSELRVKPRKGSNKQTKRKKKNHDLVHRPIAEAVAGGIAARWR